MQNLLIKTIRNGLGVLFAIAMVGCARPYGATSNTPSANSTAFASPTSQMQVASTVLNQQLEQSTASNRTQAPAQTADLGVVVAYAYPNVNQITLGTSATYSENAMYESSGTQGPYTWTRSGNTYYNSQGQPLEIGGGSIFDTYGDGALGGYFYNPTNGNQFYGGVVYIPGEGVGVGIHGCSPVNGVCGTAIAGPGGFATCVNGTCQRGYW